MFETPTPPALDLAFNFSRWAESVAKTLAEMQLWAPELPATIDLYAAFGHLAKPISGDKPQVGSRRAMCGAVSTSLGQPAGFRMGNPAAAALWFRKAAAGASAAAATASAAGDTNAAGRYGSVLATLEREAAELEALGQ